MTDQAAAPTDSQVALASANYEVQVALLRQLHHTFTVSPLTLRELATELDLTDDVARSWIEGDVDLRLSELRHLANAIGAQVTYTAATA